MYVHVIMIVFGFAMRIIIHNYYTLCVCVCVGVYLRVKWKAS